MYAACGYDQSHTLDNNIACDLQQLYFQFDAMGGQAVHISYCNHKCIHNEGGGACLPPPYIFRINTHCIWCIQAFQTDTTKSTVLRTNLVKQKILSLNSRNIIKVL